MAAEPSPDRSMVISALTVTTSFDEVVAALRDMGCVVLVDSDAVEFEDLLQQLAARDERVLDLEAELRQARAENARLQAAAAGRVTDALVNAASRAIYDLTRGHAIPGRWEGVDLQHVGTGTVARVALTAALEGGGEHGA